MPNQRRTEPLNFEVVKPEDLRVVPLKTGVGGPSIWEPLAEKLIAAFEAHLEAKKKDPEHTQDGVCIGLEGKEPEEARIWAQVNAGAQVRKLTRRRKGGQLTAKAYIRIDKTTGDPVGVAMIADHYFPRERKKTPRKLEKPAAPAT